LHGGTLMNSLVYRRRARRRARRHHLNILNNLSDACLREIEGNYFTWQQTYRGECNRRDE